MKNPLSKCLDFGLLTLSPATCHCVMRSPHSRSQTVLVEFSSLNIAKPMHMGHFRATVVGNFVKNINLAAGNKVIAVNYLGDWGTQFGMLSIGYRQCGNEKMLKRDPLKHLHSVYVSACEQFGSTEVGKQEASALATSFEKDEDPELRNLWNVFRGATVAELKRLYARMNVEFDRYEYESQFVNEASMLVDRLIAKRTAKREEDGSVTCGAHEHGKRATLLKKDGGTLYLARDLAAAVSRYERFSFDRMHYVVEDGQREHFLNLQHVLTGLGHAWAKPNSSPWPLHVRFGRVFGASSRHGSGLFLSDVLDSARLEAFQRMQRSRNTQIVLPELIDLQQYALPVTPSMQLERADEVAKQVADQLGVTWLVTEMLRMPRLHPVTMYINLSETSDGRKTPNAGAHSRFYQRDLTGFGLQYCHARLCSLEEKALTAGLIKATASLDVDKDRLHNSFYELPLSRPYKEVEDELLSHLAMLPNALTHAYLKYEADGIFRYCNQLSRLVSRAWNFLPVLGATTEETALSHLAIFRMSRNALATCLSIMGVTPLSKI